jgi:glycosyltransferase involved in cell wall biosynthesis
MKILYVMQQGSEVRKPPFDGPANHVRHVIQGLIALGHQTRLIIGLDGKYWQSDDLHSFSIIRIPNPNLIARLFEKLIRRIQTDFHLPYGAWFENQRFAAACQLAGKDADLFLERTSWMAYGAALAARKMKIPLISEFNGDPLHDLEAKKIAPEGLQRRLSKEIYRFPLKRSAALIASGMGWRDNLIQQWSVLPDQITVIENGSILVELLNRTELKTFQDNTQPESHVTLVYLGSFYAWHGTQILVRAFQRNLARFPHIRLLMIGSGSGLEETRSLVKHLNLENVVQFTGSMTSEEYAPLLATANIGVSPYCQWTEYSGLKLFDYKAAGLAIIASGENGYPVTLKHGETGIIVPPCDENALTEAINTLVNDRLKRIHLGKNARFEAEIEHTWQMTTQRIAGVCEKVNRESKRYG